MGDVSVGGEMEERERVGVKGGLDGWMEEWGREVGRVLCLSECYGH
jgi:hypothetical protein